MRTAALEGLRESHPLLLPDSASSSPPERLLEACGDQQRWYDVPQMTMSGRMKQCHHDPHAMNMSLPSMVRQVVDEVHPQHASAAVQVAPQRDRRIGAAHKALRQLGAAPKIQCAPRRPLLQGTLCRLTWRKSTLRRPHLGTSWGLSTSESKNQLQAGLRPNIKTSNTLPCQIMMHDEESHSGRAHELPSRALQEHSHMLLTAQTSFSCQYRMPIVRATGSACRDLQ